LGFLGEMEASSVTAVNLFFRRAKYGTLVRDAHLVGWRRLGERYWWGDHFRQHAEFASAYSDISCD
jgi:hypothetical protein